jgi:hypothetical protein
MAFFCAEDPSALRVPAAQSAGEPPEPEAPAFVVLSARLGRRELAVVVAAARG